MFLKNIIIGADGWTGPRVLRRLPIYPVASAHIRTAHSSDYLDLSALIIYISPSTLITCLIILSFLLSI
jgi:hypothetical protein